MFIPNGFGLARFGFNLTGDPEKMVVTIGYRPLVGDDFAAHDGALTGLEQDFFDNIVVGAASMSNSFTYLGLEATAAIGAGFVSIIKPRTVAGTGPTTGFAALPQNCAYLVKKKTAFVGRRNQGRLYMPMIHLGEGDVTAAGVISAATVTALQTRWTNFHTDSLAGGNYELQLLHSSPAMGDARDITAFVVDTTIATQRRRLRG